MNNEKTPLLTEEQKFALAASLISKAPKIFAGVSLEEGQKLLGDPESHVIFRDAILARFPMASERVASIALSFRFAKIVQAQEVFYREVFGKECCFANLAIPDAGKSFGWIMCMTPDVSAHDLLFEGKNPPGAWKVGGASLPLDDMLDLSFGRDGAVNPYVFRCEAALVAGMNLASKSADDIVADGLVTMCAKERLAIGRFMYWFKGKGILLDCPQQDEIITTLCSGSRFKDGGIPRIHTSSDGEVAVDVCGASGASDFMRHRQVVIV